MKGGVSDYEVVVMRTRRHQSTNGHYHLNVLGPHRFH